MLLEREGRGIEIVLPALADARIEVLRGSTAPIGGWVSRAFDSKVPAPTLVWRARLAGTTTLKTTLDCCPDSPVGAVVRETGEAARSS